MSPSKFRAAALLGALVALLSARIAPAQTAGAKALGYASYALGYAQSGLNDYARVDSGVESLDYAFVKNAYNFTYNTCYYTYYGYYVDHTYFGFAYGNATASHDVWLQLYNSPLDNPGLKPDINYYYAQYFSSLAAYNSYNARFGG